MMTTTATAASPPWGPAATAAERASNYASASVEASSRAAFRDQAQAGVSSETKQETAKAQAAAQAAVQVPDVMKGLSTVAVAGAMASTPAAINMMREIALASASGALTDADRRALQDEYAQLSQQVATSVGSVDAGEQAQTQARQREDQREDDDTGMYRQTSDDRRTTLTQTAVEPVESTEQQPVTRSVTTQRSVLVADGHGTQRDPQQTFRTQRVHVGTDSYEPVSTRQRQSQPILPQTLGHVDNHAETRSVTVVQAAQVTRFVEVAHTQTVAPLSAIA